MMLNLFTIFDFNTYFYLYNWISTILGLLILPQIYWMMSSRILFLLNELMKMLCKEFNLIFKFKFNLNNLIFFVVLFMFIMFNNFMGLFSYVFTSSSHLVYSMIFSFSMWLGLMYFGWLNNTKFMFIHLVPQGTPMMLMFFMVFIELLSSLIRPMTLCIRLTANMIAGHLLLTLLALFIPKNIFYYFLMLIIQMMLLILEVFVSFIQSYVFVILISLYLKETN